MLLSAGRSQSVTGSDARITVNRIAASGRDRSESDGMEQKLTTWRVPPVPADVGRPLGLSVRDFGDRQAVAGPGERHERGR